MVEGFPRETRTPASLGQPRSLVSLPDESAGLLVRRGFTPEKSKIISSVLEAADWARLELVEFVDGIALSHAGIGSSVFAPPIGDLTKERVERLCAEAWLDAEAGLPNPVFDLSGIVWLRWWHLRPLEAFSQFVGHTPDRALRIDRGVATANACLDSFGRYLGWIEDGFMSVLDDHRGEPVWGMETRTA